MTRSIQVPSCACVVAARRKSILAIPDKFESEGQGVSDSCAGPIYGCLTVVCGYCKTLLYVQEGFDLSS